MNCKLNHEPDKPFPLPCFFWSQYSITVTEVKLERIPRGPCAVDRAFIHYDICSCQQGQQPDAWGAEQTTNKQKDDGFFLYAPWGNPEASAG